MRISYQLFNSQMLETKNIKIKETGGDSGAGKNMWHLFSSNDFLFTHI